MDASGTPRPSLVARTQMTKWTERGMAVAAVALPVFVSLSRVAVDSAWRDDLAVVRGLGLIAASGPSTLSTMLMQALSLVPIGPLTLRMGLVSVIGLAACAALIRSLAHQILDAHVPNSPLNAPLAAMAALTATLGPALQREATVAGAATVPLAVSLLVLILASRTWRSQPSSHLLIALALGAVAAESIVAAGAMTTALLVMLVQKTKPPTTRQAATFVFTALASAAVFGFPMILRPTAPHAWLDIGRTLTTYKLLPLDTSARAVTAIAAWQSEVGTISVALATVGLVMGVVRQRTRFLAVSLGVLVLADIVFPATTGAVLSVDVLLPLRLLAVASVAIAASLGVQTTAITLMDMALPMARVAAVLVVMFNVTLVAFTAEQAAFSSDRSRARGATTFTEEALDKLDPDAMIFARSHAITWRLLAARIVEGSRPDVLVVPMPLLGHGRLASDLLTDEPSAAMLLRDIAVTGSPGEHAVTYVADRRPLYVELDPAWDSKVAAHLTPNGLWLRLWPQPGGVSDRRLAMTSVDKSFARVAAEVKSLPDTDVATNTVLISMARQQALAAAMIPDRKATAEMLERIKALDPNDLFVRDMNQRLEHARGKTIETKGLMR